MVMKCLPDVGCIYDQEEALWIKNSLTPHGIIVNSETLGMGRSNRTKLLLEYDRHVRQVIQRILDYQQGP